MCTCSDSLYLSFSLASGVSVVVGTSTSSFSIVVARAPVTLERIPLA